MGFGWALVAAAESRQDAPRPTVELQVVTRDVLVWPEHEATPYADSLVDWDEHERQSACLWDFLQAHNIELTLQNILTAGDWTDMNGGACAMMEDWDDPYLLENDAERDVKESEDGQRNEP
jgi:hypothetical protein